MTDETQATEEKTAKQTRELEVVRSVESSAIVGDVQRAMFMPANMGEAMEMATLMAGSNFMPKHLRGKPGDCLAVIMQSSRWGMDPYAVGNKTYFVNDRMAFEAQLVAAVVNSSNVLEGRLIYEWSGSGENLKCKASGKIKGDPEIREREVELKTITTRNSPLWKQDPEQQLAYYTGRAWARLHTPEVLMGVYTTDEIEAIPATNKTNRITRATLADHAEVTLDADAGGYDEAEVEALVEENSDLIAQEKAQSRWERMKSEAVMAIELRQIEALRDEFDAYEDEIPLADRPAVIQAINDAAERISNS